MSNGKLAGIIVTCTIAIIAVIVLTGAEPWERACTLSVAVNPAQTGSVSPAGGQYERGTQVTLSASPASGYTFDHWSGSAVGTAPTITITMNGNKSVAAHFKEVPTLRLTLEDAPRILDLSSVLPPGFDSRYSSEPTESRLLGTGSGSQFNARGKVLVTRPWYQIQLILWIVDAATAADTSVEMVLAEYHLTGNRIHVGEGVEAIKNGDHGSGLEFLVIKHRNAYVVMNSFYTHPQDNYVRMIELAAVIGERLIEYSE